MLELIKKHINNLSERLRRKRLPKEAQDRHDIIDDLEKEMALVEQIECPTEDIFTPGLYTRVIKLPKGTVLTSEIHKFEHPFFILDGVVEVINIETGEKVLYSAPFLGITMPYTRRLLNVIEETIWVTCHVTNETNVEKIGKKILVQRDTVVPQYKLNKTKTLQS